MAYQMPELILSLNAGDFNGNGRVDLAVAGRTPLTFPVDGGYGFNTSTSIDLLMSDMNGNLKLASSTLIPGVQFPISGEFDNSFDELFTSDGLLKMIAPTITLSNSTVVNLQPGNSLVGNVSATSTDIGQPNLTYQLVSGVGSTDNAAIQPRFHRQAHDRGNGELLR